MTKPAAGRWEHFPHGADVGVRGLGPTREAAFAQAAVAMTAAVTDPSQVAARERVQINCEAPNEEFLLLAFLNALVYETATRGMLFGRFELRIGERDAGSVALEGEAWGEVIDPKRHQPASEVKGATLTQLKVARGADGEWLAQCVVDV
mgnify:CR=1 FL=1